MNVAELRRRIGALSKAITPSGSIAARLAALAPDQQKEYAVWKNRSAAYHAAFHGGEAYERLLAGDEGPTLRRDVRDALFGPEIVILASATTAQVADTYAQLLKKP